MEPDFDGFEWSDVKSEATFQERQIDFEAAAAVFDGPYLEREDLRDAYGEPRYIVTGETQGIVLTVVWTPRKRNRRIISAWPATKREEREYHEYRKKVDSTDPQG